MMRRAIAGLAVAVALTACGTAGHGAQVGTYPHCRYGVAHAYGSPAQCAMPEPKGSQR